MKILHCVESYFPKPGGMQEVVRQLSERLAAMGHEVLVVTKKEPERDTYEMNGVKIVDFEIAGNQVNGIQGDKSGYVEYLQNSQQDIITFFAAQQWATDLALPILKQIRGKKVFVPTGFPGLFWPGYQAYFRDMERYLHDFDMHVFLSTDFKDINFARKCGVKNWRVIANGADEKEFSRKPEMNVRKELRISDDDFLLLHVGSYTGFKGQLEAIDIFLRSGIRNGTLLMIGNGSEFFRVPRKRPDLRFRLLMNRLFGSKKIIFKWFPREVTVAAYHEADLFLFPSNIECSPVVLFECAAAGLPFLSTNAGNAAEIASWTGAGEILPTAIDKKGFSHAKIRGSAKLLNALYADRTRRLRMSENGRRTWLQKFTWSNIAHQYESLYLQLLQDDRR